MSEAVMEAQEQQEAVDTSALGDADLEKALSSPEPEEPAEADAKPEGDTEDKPEETPKEKPKEKPPQEPTEEEKAAKQKADKEAFLLRQKAELANLEAEIRANANLVGEMRKRAAELRAEAQDATETLVAIDKAAEAREMDRRAADLENASQISVTRRAVSTLVPEFETLIPEVIEIVGEHLTALGKTDEERAEIISGFKRSPYNTSPATLAALASAAMARKEAATLRSEVAKLKDENAKLAKKPDEVLKRVAKAADSPSVLSGKSSGASKGGVSKGDLTADQIAELSEEQLNALLAEAKESEKGG